MAAESRAEGRLAVNDDREGERIGEADEERCIWMLRVGELIDGGTGRIGAGNGVGLTARCLIDAEDDDGGTGDARFSKRSVWPMRDAADVAEVDENFVGLRLRARLAVAAKLEKADPAPIVEPGS